MYSYRFYATLLDSFQYYLSKVDYDNAFDEFIDRLNRKPFFSEAAMKGTAFNEFIDRLNAGEINDLRPDGKGNFLFEYTEGDIVMTFAFKEKIVNEISRRVKGALPQIRVSAPLETRFGLVELYGNADELLFDKCIDIKTTSRYDFPKFLNGWQSKVYPYCFNASGIKVSTFEYLITDFSNVYIEEYPWRPEKDIRELKGFCEQLIDFIENNRSLITDQKVFAIDHAEAHQNIP